LRVGRRGLHRGDATALEAPTESRDRRLLVLNVCDAALAALTGALPEVGIGPAAAAPAQAVIGHLWLVQGWPDSPLFGRRVADGLTTPGSFLARMKARSACSSQAHAWSRTSLTAKLES
jgi:hypothetical protein